MQAKTTTTKIYGNARSDGFAPFMLAIAALFGLGGAAMAQVGAVVLVAGLVVFVLLAVLMARTLSKWDVMSEVGPAKDAAQAAMADVKVTTFPMPAASELTPSAWSPSKLDDKGLPAAVTKPKAPVETNTQVAA